MAGWSCVVGSRGVHPFGNSLNRLFRGPTTSRVKMEPDDLELQLFGPWTNSLYYLMDAGHILCTQPLDSGPCCRLASLG